MMLPFIRRRLHKDTRKLGRWGEGYCQRYLKKNGYRPIAQNFRCKSGEIDLIMADTTGAIVFVEVKTRKSETKAPAQQAVTPNKRRYIIRAANQFVRKYNIKNKPLRFDVAAVILPVKGPIEIRHYKNAFVP
jgi:putative endonuclease